MTVTNSISSTIPALLKDVIGNIIFRNLSLTALGTCCRVCKAWNKMASAYISAYTPPNAFGPKEWFTYFGCRLQDVHQAPLNIQEILQNLCIFNPKKTVGETHMLVFIPEIVGGRPLNLRLLGEIVQKPLQGNPTKYNFFNPGEYTDSPAPKSHWALMTRTVIEESRNKSHKNQQAMLANYSQKAQTSYQVPTVLDGAVCIFMEYIRTGTQLYTAPLNYTRCLEKHTEQYPFAIGGYCMEGLVIYCNAADECSGVAGLRRFDAVEKSL